MIIYKNIQELMQDLTKSRTKYQIAKQTGIHASLLKQYEDGISDITRKNLAKFEESFEVTVEEFCKDKFYYGA